MKQRNSLLMVVILALVVGALVPAPTAATSPVRLRCVSDPDPIGCLEGCTGIDRHINLAVRPSAIGSGASGIVADSKVAQYGLFAYMGHDAGLGVEKYIMWGTSGVGDCADPSVVGSDCLVGVGTLNPDPDAIRVLITGCGGLTVEAAMAAACNASGLQHCMP